ncbi:MFS transporter [Streptomyces sp. NPDC015144]|uniref:MFS transporter n=1 Tax=Streptomyces sp. NPDC015144 TaxID=3364944 RepID=UPI0036FD706A
MTAPATGAAAVPTPLRIPAFRRFLLANLVSTTGSAMAPLALAYAVIGQGGGAGSLGTVLATNSVPTIVFLLAGGVLADRFSRSRILFLGNLLAALAQGALAALVATGHATTASIASCGFVSGVAAAFTAPAAGGVVGQLVAAEQLLRANALVRLPNNAVKVLGPVAAGVIVAVGGPGWALSWDALSFLVAALLLLGLRLDAPVAVAGGVIADLRAGWAGFRGRVWLWTYTVSGTVVVAAWLAGFQLLGPVVAAEHYAGARSWGLVQGAFASGLLAGTVLCLRWKPDRLLAVAVVASAGLCLPPTALGLGLPLLWVLLGAVLAGIGLDVAVVAWNTALQQQVPRDELGRMSAFNGVGERIAIPVGYLVVALSAQVWTGRTVLLVCSGAIVAATLLNLCVRDVYRVHRLRADQ